MRRRLVRTTTAVAAAALALGFAPALPAHAETFPANDRRVLATSTQGREITAWHYGALDAPVQLVVLGQMHGSEPGGRDVVQDLTRRPVPDGVGLWLVPTMNPDGHARGTRVNARGIDLNRNFPERWVRAGRGGIFWSGGKAASERETRGVMRFLEEVRPTAVLSFHQAYDVVDISHARSRPAGRQLARWMGEQARPVPCSGPCHGTLTQWVDAELGAIAITVELDDRVSRKEADRAATAVLRLGSWLGR